MPGKQHCLIYDIDLHQPGNLLEKAFPQTANVVAADEGPKAKERRDHQRGEARCPQEAVWTEKAKHIALNEEEPDEQRKAHVDQNIRVRGTRRDRALC